MRVLVVEAVAHVERAVRGDAQRFGEEIGRIQRFEIVAGAQVPLAVREQRMAGLGDGRAEADRGHDILQRAPFAHVHVHVAGGDQRKIMTFAEFAQHRESRGIVGAAMQLDGEPGAIAEMTHDPVGVLVEMWRCVASDAHARTPRRATARRRMRDILRYPEHGDADAELFRIRARQVVFAFRAAAAAGRDQPADVGVAVLAHRQQDELRSIGEPDFGADDELDAGVFRCFAGAHDAGQRAFVGDRERGVAECLRALEQFGRARCAALEREIGKAMQFGVDRSGRFAIRNALRSFLRSRIAPAVIEMLRAIPFRFAACEAMPAILALQRAARIVVGLVGDAGLDRRAQAARPFRLRRFHANQPCSIQPLSEPAGTKAQPRWPRCVSIT